MLPVAPKPRPAGGLDGPVGRVGRGLDYRLLIPPRLRDFNLIVKWCSSDVEADDDGVKKGGDRCSEWKRDRTFGFGSVLVRLL
jgi:hypothetical protein